jgi:hypothetical protein
LAQTQQGVDPFYRLSFCENTLNHREAQALTQAQALKGGRMNQAAESPPKNHPGLLAY